MSPTYRLQHPSSKDLWCRFVAPGLSYSDKFLRTKVGNSINLWIVIRGSIIDFGIKQSNIKLCTKLSRVSNIFCKFIYDTGRRNRDNWRWPGLRYWRDWLPKGPVPDYSLLYNNYEFYESYKISRIDSWSSFWLVYFLWILLFAFRSNAKVRKRLFKKVFNCSDKVRVHF